MLDRYEAAAVLTVGLLGAVAAGYQTFLAAPAAVAARPELADLGFWTALFSGRFTAWLFWHEPVVGAVIYVTAFALIGAIVAVGAGKRV